MKKIILTVAAVFALTFANAQDKKEGSEGLASGDVLLTGDFNFSSASKGDLKADDLTLSPGLAYMMSDNLAIIGQLAISSGKTDDGAGTEIKTSGFGIAAGVRYFLTPASKFSLSIGAQLGYGSTKEDDGVADVTTKTTSLSVPVGLHYFVSNNFAITSTWGGLGYSSVDDGSSDKASGFGLSLGMSNISFGLAYKL